MVDENFENKESLIEALAKMSDEEASKTAHKFISEKWGDHGITVKAAAMSSIMAARKKFIEEKQK